MGLPERNLQTPEKHFSHHSCEYNFYMIYKYPMSEKVTFSRKISSLNKIENMKNIIQFFACLAKKYDEHFQDER